jgi:hypothetical protein
MQVHIYIYIYIYMTYDANTGNLNTDFFIILPWVCSIYLLMQPLRGYSSCGVTWILPTGKEVGKSCEQLYSNGKSFIFIDFRSCPIAGSSYYENWILRTVGEIVKLGSTSTSAHCRGDCGILQLVSWRLSDAGLKVFATICDINVNNVKILKLLVGIKGNLPSNFAIKELQQYMTLPSFWNAPRICSWSMMYSWSLSIRPTSLLLSISGNTLWNYINSPKLDCFPSIIR